MRKLTSGCGCPGHSGSEVLMEDFHAIIKMCFAASVMCINASTCNGASAQCPWLAVAFAHLWACMANICSRQESLYVCMRRLLTTVGNERAADTPYRAIRERQTAIISTTPPKLACVVEKIFALVLRHMRNGKKSDGIVWFACSAFNKAGGGSKRVL
jgi:hypothetical protein